MVRDVIADFVDREEELAQFRRMLTGESDERILLILEPGEKGKTYFTQRLFHECEQQRPRVPVALLDFDQRRSGLTDYLSVAREIRRYLSDDCTPAICACEDDIFHPAPLVNVQTGAGDAGVDWGRNGRFAGADVSGITGRDHINVQVGSISEAIPTADRMDRQRVEMGRALCRDLADLTASHHRIVLLMDTFEQAPEETRRWLEYWLFKPLRRELSHITLVVAGRPVCWSFFDQSHLWSSLVAPIDRFDPFSDDEILAHYRLRGIPFSEAEVPLLLDLARPSPAAMANVGDVLEQARGGER